MTGPAIVPYLSYVNAKGAMAFLSRAFAFETVQAFDGEDGRLVHGQVKYGTGVIMLGAVEAGGAKASRGIYGHEWSFGTYQPSTEAPDWG